MITAIIETRDDEVQLAHALAALVPAATEGALRDVVVIDHGSADGTLVVADAAGCVILPANSEATEARHRAVADARGDWLLFLSPHSVLDTDWHNEALAFIDRTVVDGVARARVAVFRDGRLLRGWRRRLASWLAGRPSRLLAPPRPGQARLISKGYYLAHAGRLAGDEVFSALAVEASSASGARRGAA